MYTRHFDKISVPQNYSGIAYNADYTENSKESSEEEIEENPKAKESENEEVTDEESKGEEAIKDGLFSNIKLGNLLCENADLLLLFLAVILSGDGNENPEAVLFLLILLFCKNQKNDN